MQPYDADTIMFPTYSMTGSTNAIPMWLAMWAILQSVMFRQLHLSHMMDGSIKGKAQIFSCHDFCTSDIANIIIPFHTLTGWDSSNGFYSHGKESLYDKVAKILQLMLVRNYL